MINQFQKSFINDMYYRQIRLDKNRYGQVYDKIGLIMDVNLGERLD